MTASSSGSSTPTSSARTARSRTRTTTSSPRDKIEGPWSDPVYVNSSGFDPSLFHDDDGRKWFVNMLWDHRARPLLFEGIALQEYDPKAGQARRPAQEHLPGHRPEAGRGPASLQAQRLVLPADRRGRHRLRARLHLRALAQHRRALRDSIPKSTSSPPRTRPFNAVQRSGHGDIVETPDGKTYFVHLMGRPDRRSKRRCVLGRETGIQEAEWRDDDWLWRQERPGARRSKSKCPAPATTPPTGPSSATASTARCTRISSGCARPRPTASSSRRTAS